MTAIIINIDDYRRQKKSQGDNDLESAIQLVSSITLADEHADESVGAPTSIDIMPAWNIIMTAATNRNHGYRLSDIRHNINMMNAYIQRTLRK